MIQIKLGSAFLTETANEDFFENWGEMDAYRENLYKENHPRSGGCLAAAEFNPGSARAPIEILAMALQSAANSVSESTV